MGTVESIVREREKRKCIASFYEFVRHAWHVCDPAKFVEAWHLKVLCQHMQDVHEGRSDNLIVNMPPGHGKSLVASVMFPAWVWATRPEKIFLCAANTDKLATRDSVRCRDLIRSDWYQDTFRPRWSLKEDQDEKTYYVNTAHGGRWSMGVAAKATGARSDYTIIDDPLDAQRGVTPNALREIAEWHDQKMVSRRIDTTRGEIVIMQRLHENDLVGHLLKTYGSRYSHLYMQAEYDPESIPPGANKGFTDPRSKGELLFPQVYTRERINHLKLALGSYGSAAQLQQSPKTRVGGYFNRTMFGRFSYSDLSPIDFDMAFSSWDCAVEGGENSDNVAGQVWARVRGSHEKHGGKFALWDSVVSRTDMAGTLRLIKALHEKHRFVSLKLIEKKANGAPIIQLLRNEFGDDSVIPFEPGSRSKELRASAVSPACEAGRVIIPHDGEASWVDSWLSEMESFPKGQHDDQVDATTQALLHLTQSREWSFVF